MLTMIHQDDFIISAEDLTSATGKSDLKPCPFCDSKASSSGLINQETKIIAYMVNCSNIPDCMATLSHADRDAEIARIGVVRKWNKRI